MDLVKALLKEHSKAQTTKITAYIGEDAKRFADLVDIFFKGPYRVTQRASWVISHCVESHPHLLKPHLKKIIVFAQKDGVHDAVKRNVVRLLQFVEIPEAARGLAFDMCINFLRHNTVPVAVKAFSMTVLFNISLHEPELKNELRILIEDQLPYSSPAFVSRGKKILKLLAH
jgi:hypothetical protein